MVGACNQVINTQKILVAKSEETRSIGRSNVDRKTILKCILKTEGSDWFHLALDGLLENGDDESRFTKYGKLFNRSATISFSKSSYLMELVQSFTSRFTTKLCIGNNGQLKNI
jgi:hypothetical protein